MIWNVHEINWEAPWLWHYMQKNTGSQKRPLKVSNGNNVESYFYLELCEPAKKQYGCFSSEFVVLVLVCLGVLFPLMLV